jgi:hypothetical protein
MTTMPRYKVTYEVDTDDSDSAVMADEGRELIHVYLLDEPEYDPGEDGDRTCPTCATSVPIGDGDTPDECPACNKMLEPIEEVV